MSVDEISGQLHVNVGTMHPAPGARPRNAQLYLYDPDCANAARKAACDVLDPAIVALLDSNLRAHVEIPMGLLVLIDRL